MNCVKAFRLFYKYAVNEHILFHYQYPYTRYVSHHFILHSTVALILLQIMNCASQSIFFNSSSLDLNSESLLRKCIKKCTSSSRQVQALVTRKIFSRHKLSVTHHFPLTSRSVLHSVANAGIYTKGCVTVFLFQNQNFKF